MKNPEYEKRERVNKDETGFSEKQLDLDIEMRAGEWHNPKKFHAYLTPTRQKKKAKKMGG